MQVLRDTLPRATMCDEARAQMQKGLDGYKGDGEGWDFESLGLEETMMTTKAENWRPNCKWWKIGGLVVVDIDGLTVI